MSPSRWLTWTPEASMMQKTSDPELTKPTKPGFVSFVSPHVGASPIIERAKLESEESVTRTWPVKRQSRQDFDPLWGDPCPCGSREWWKLPGPILECKACGRSARSEYLARGTAEQSAAKRHGNHWSNSCLRPFGSSKPFRSEFSTRHKRAR
jgi:hypothetical protein